MAGARQHLVFRNGGCTLADDDPIVLATPIPSRPIAPSFRKPPAHAAARTSSYAIWQAAHKGDHDALSRLASAEADRDAPRVAPVEESGNASSAHSLFVSFCAGAHKRMQLWTLVCARKPPQSMQRRTTPPQPLEGPQHCWGARKPPLPPGSRSATIGMQASPATLPPSVPHPSASAPATASTSGPPAASANAAAASAAEPQPQPFTAEELACLWCEEVLVEVRARP